MSAIRTRRQIGCSTSNRSKSSLVSRGYSSSTFLISPFTPSIYVTSSVFIESPRPKARSPIANQPRTTGQRDLICNR
ncbi:expressed protein [Echinococcus multilocularis]|uniref:Expressed protein n=1 Tax=Echinococcus multilocularis TaxID=6211 RepID=A0A087VWT5_ECHMU|nr:expressed protein [Echinococcus multilocularis]